VAQRFGELAPQIDASLQKHLLADIFVNAVLDYQQRGLITISALVSLDGVEGQQYYNIIGHPGIVCHNFFCFYKK